MNEFIQIEHNGAIAIITLNRPDKRNALNLELLTQLYNALESLSDKQRAIILTGKGPVFCAGMDLQEASRRENIESLANLIAKCFTALYKSPLITIAAVNGPVFAGGAGLMSACDFVVAVENASISYPEIHRGIIPAQVSALLTRQVGWRMVKELLLLGQPITSLRGKEIGLINRVVKEGEALKEALDLADMAIKGDAMIIAETKRLLEVYEAHPFEKDLQLALSGYLCKNRITSPSETT